MDQTARVTRCAIQIDYPSVGSRLRIDLQASYADKAFVWTGIAERNAAEGLGTGRDIQSDMWLCRCGRHRYSHIQNQQGESAFGFAQQLAPPSSV